MGLMEGANWTVWTRYLLPLAVWPTSVLLAIVWASWLLMECPYGWFLPPPSPPTPPPPTPPHRPSLSSILMAERDSKKYLEIQPSETEKVIDN